MSAPLFHFRDRVTGELVAVFDISLLEGEIPYPFVLQWEQYKLVHAALPHIRASGIGEVRFSTKVTGLAQHADHVDVIATNEAGESETIRGRYVIGTDGGSSTRAQGRRHRVRGLHLPGALHQDRHQLRLRQPPARASAPATISSIRTSGSTCSRSRATARPASGAACSRCRPARPTRRR